MGTAPLASHATTSGGPAPAGRRAALRIWLQITGAVLLLGFINFGIQVTSWLAEREHHPVRYAFLWEMTGALAFLLMLPALLAFFRRFPVRAGNAWHRVPLYLAVMLLLAAAQTALMWSSREALYALLGWGHYDYGDMRYRYPMEALKLMLGYGGAFFVYRAITAARAQREREVAAARLEQQLSEARLASLKAQLNPHFLFNTLNMISSHVHDTPDVADAMLAHLADFLRLTLSHAEAQEVPLGTELEFLDAYLAIMKARFEERLTVEVRLEPSSRVAMVPHLILQPLVENAVTHAMAEAGRQGRIKVAAGSFGNRLRLTVADNGPGLAEGQEPRHGVGLANTVERLRHLYGPDHSFALRNLPEGGLEVALELPLRQTGPAAGRRR
jgi:two-component system, LytTR family, sensor kinase